MGERTLTHLVAYGTPDRVSPDMKVQRDLEKVWEEGRRRWPVDVVKTTEAGKMLCGLDREEARAIALHEYATQTTNPADLCPACVEAAAKAGRPVPTAAK